MFYSLRLLKNVFGILCVVFLIEIRFLVNFIIFKNIRFYNY